jgi:hypothetical protein
MNRPPLYLVLTGLGGLLFFWLTDPTWGLYQPESRVIDAASDASVGTIVGLVGSGVTLLVGLWLVTRKAV